MVSFSKEHHFGLLLVWKIKQGFTKHIDPERISNYVLFFFKEDLNIHFKDEETMLFTQLPETDELRIKAETDHQNIYHLIENIEANKKDTHALLVLADALDKHIRFEERSLFNHLQNNMDEKSLEAIEKRMSQGDSNIDAKWEDLFWIGAQ